MPDQTYRISINRASLDDPTHTVTVHTDDDPKEVHIYDATGQMIAALDLFADRIEAVRFGPDGNPAETLTIPAST